MLKVTRFIRKEKVFFIFLILSPEFWWILFKLPEVITDWLKFPSYISQKFSSIFVEERLVNVGLLRWAEIDTAGWLKTFSKLIYNRADLLVDEFFNFLTYLSPRIYFQAGDGSRFTPGGLEPLPFILFPLFIFGFVISLKQKKFRQLIYLFIFTFIAYLVGGRNFSFLFPVAIIFLWFASKGFRNTSEKYQTLLLYLIIFYSLYLGGRMIWLLL